MPSWGPARGAWGLCSALTSAPRSLGDLGHWVTWGGGGSLTAAASPCASGEDGGEEGALQSSSENFVLHKQKSRPTAAPGAAWQGLCPTNPNPSASGCCPCPYVAAAFIPIYQRCSANLVS